MATWQKEIVFLGAIVVLGMKSSAAERVPNAICQEQTIYFLQNSVAILAQFTLAQNPCAKKYRILHPRLIFPAQGSGIYCLWCSKSYLPYLDKAGIT